MWRQTPPPPPARGPAPRRRHAAAATAPPASRGLHTSTSQLNLSTWWSHNPRTTSSHQRLITCQHSAGAYTRPLPSSTRAVSDTKAHPTQPLTTPGTSKTPPEQPLHTPPIPQKALKLSRKVGECKPLQASTPPAWRGRGPSPAAWRTTLRPGYTGTLSANSQDDTVPR